MRVLGIAGSLRQKSFNRALLQAARELASAPLDIAIFDLAPIPSYNADVDTDQARPAAVTELRDEVKSADGLLIATPEYNHSVPGVLQNAIDWVSRPGNQSPFAGKPVAIIGASPGIVGTARAQQQLKLVMMSTLALVMPHPGVLVGQAKEKFDGGRLIHEPTRQFLQAFLKQFAEWIFRVGKRP